MAESTQSLTTTAVISVRWASAFQQQAGERALREVLRAWREFYSEKNKGNIITIDIGDGIPPKGESFASLADEAMNELRPIVKRRRNA